MATEMPEPAYLGSYDGTRIAAYDLGGRGPDLILAHATGFCASVLLVMARELAGRFRCVAFDARGHGRSGTRPGGDDEFDWHAFGADALCVVEGMGLREPYGFGHSCGGAALLLAEESSSSTFSGLYLYEPVVFPSDTPLEPSFENNPLSAGALRRRSSFASRQEALDNFASKPPFEALDPEVLKSYVADGFVDDSEGGIHLACDPRHEAMIYAQGFSHDAFSRLDEVKCHVTLACGEKTDAFGPDFLSLFAARLSSVDTVVLPGLHHFGPLEAPAEVAASVAASLGALSP